jgi:predicted nucleic acid-binding protein
MSGWLLDTNVATLLFDAKHSKRAPDAVRRATEIVEEHGRSPIAAVSLFELKRGVRRLLAEGKGARKAAELDRWLLRAEVFGLDQGKFAGWTLAADLWAAGRTHKPARVFSDADLLIVATAFQHDRVLVTGEGRLAILLHELGYGHRVEVLPFEVPTNP